MAVLNAQLFKIIQSQKETSEFADHFSELFNFYNSGFIFHSLQVYIEVSFMDSKDEFEARLFCFAFAIYIFFILKNSLMVKSYLNFAGQLFKILACNGLLNVRENF